MQKEGKGDSFLFPLPPDFHTTQVPQPQAPLGLEMAARKNN